MTGGHRAIIFGFLPQNLKTMAVAVAFIMAWREARDQAGTEEDQARGLLAAFRGELYRCLAKRPDALFEVCDAVLCRPERVHMLAELSLEPECRRGHGAMYDAVNHGEVQVARLRRALAGLPMPAWDDGRIRLAADVSNWLRPDAETSPERLFCHCYARGKGNAQMIPGWPYSFIAALEPGRTSWTLPLDAVRLGPADDATAVTAAQVRGVIGRVIAAGHWHDGDPDIMVIFNAGYGQARLAWLLSGPPRAGAGAAGHQPGAAAGPAQPRRPGQMGPPIRHGCELKLSDDAADPSRAGPAHHHADLPVRGPADARAWHRMHPKLKARGPPWAGPPGETAGHRGHPHQASPSITCPHDRRPQAGLAVDLLPRDADPTMR